MNIWSQIIYFLMTNLMIQIYIPTYVDFLLFPHFIFILYLMNVEM